jgi:hypothetical protein
MPTFSQLPSGKWRVQVRRAGIYRAATFPTKREARDWAAVIESQAAHIAAGGFAPVPKGSTVGDLIDKYTEDHTKAQGKTKASTLDMLKREIGSVRLASLSAVVLRDFIDRRVKAGAGGVTVAADLSYLSAVLKWGRHARQLDIPAQLALEARESLKHRGLETRSKERERTGGARHQRGGPHGADPRSQGLAEQGRQRPGGAAAAGGLVHRRTHAEGPR